MMFWLSGEKHGRIETPFLFFSNKDMNYTINFVSDDVPGVVYRTGTKSWIDTFIMPQYLANKREMRDLPNGPIFLLFFIDCRAHNFTDELEESAKNINTVVKYFPPNAKHLAQP